MTPLRIAKRSSREGGPPDTQVGKGKQDLRIKVQTLKKHESISWKYISERKPRLSCQMLRNYQRDEPNFLSFLLTHKAVVLWMSWFLHLVHNCFQRQPIIANKGPNVAKVP